MLRIKRLIHEVHHRSIWQILIVYLGASCPMLLPYVEEARAALQRLAGEPRR